MIKEMDIAIQAFSQKYPYFTYRNYKDSVQVVCKDLSIESEKKGDPKDLLEYLTDQLHRNIVKEWKGEK